MARALFNEELNVAELHVFSEADLVREQLQLVLECMGDHIVDIGEQTHFLVTGVFREFTDASHPDRADALGE